MAFGQDVQFYGSVTVSMRGQIVIPTQARRDLNIERGEKLLVVGGPGSGLILIRASAVGSILDQWAGLIHRLQEEGTSESGAGTGE